MKTIFFDSETTGVPKNYKAPYTDVDNWPRLVQIGYIVYEDEKETFSVERIVKPEGFVISEEVSKIHGVTHQQAILEGHEIGDVLGEFLDFVKESDVLVGHNLNYDMNVIAAEFHRKSLTSPFVGKSLYDTMLKGTSLCKIPGSYGKYKWPKLYELYNHLFHEPLAQTHTALDDIRQTAKCYFEMKRIGVV